MIKTIAFAATHCMLAQFIKMKQVTSKGTLVRIDDALHVTGSEAFTTDIVVVNGNTASGASHTFNSYGQLVVNRVRPSKDHQMAIINHAAKRARVESFLPQQCWSIGTETGLYDDDLVLVKPSDGARGVFHFVMKIRDFRAYLSSTGGDIKESSLRQAGVEVTKAGLRPGETAENLKQGDMCIWKFIENIAYEIRIITGADGLAGFAHKREREIENNGEPEGKSVPFAQATGKDVRVIKSRLQDAMDPEHYELFGHEINKVLKQLHRPLHSFDIFVTTDNKWGIFEYSHEFGCSAIHSNWLVPELQNYCDLLHDLKDVYDANQTP